MIPRVNYNTIGIYESLDFQKHRQSYAYGRVFPMPVPFDTLLPFQFPVTSGDNVTSFKLIKLEDNSEIDILAAANGGGLQVIQEDGYNLIIYPASSSLGTGQEIGQYYYKFSIGGNTYYSDIFVWKRSVSELIKIDCWHGEDFEYTGGKIRYRSPYKTTMYVCSEIGKPTYPYEEEVEQREGYNFPVQQLNYKLHKFVMLAPEYLLDCFRLFRLHDFVEITAKGRIHEVDELIMNNPEWLQDGDLASVLVEFKTDSVVVTNARGATNLEYDQEQTTITCPISIVGQYLGIEAESAGLANGDYFADTSFAGIVVQFNPSVAFYNDTEASAALTEDSCYAVTQSNEFGLPKGTIRKLNPETVYNSDSEAIGNGVQFEEIYYAGYLHESGVPYGTAIIQKTDIN